MPSKGKAWRRQRILLAMENGTAKAVPALTRDGVAVHYLRGGHYPGWRVTHLASGAGILPYGLTRPTAEAFARALLRLGDWCQDARRVKRFGPGVGQIRKRLFGHT